SADSVVPGNPSGGMDGVAITPLTIDFHEGGFLGKLNAESRTGFWFELGREERQQHGSPMGPANPQSLNRYSYVTNNPLRYVDPTGHARVLNAQEATDFRIGLLKAIDAVRGITDPVEFANTLIDIAGSTSLAGTIIAELAKAVIEGVFNINEALDLLDWLQERVGAYLDWERYNSGELLVIELIAVEDAAYSERYTVSLNLYFGGQKQFSRSDLSMGIFRKLRVAFDGQISRPDRSRSGKNDHGNH
ncbi:MAG: hypothetical protein HC828_03795, partial [Blastochloris sp.]|nr:hypothetical protein [Blastochloris sp.]